MSQVFSDENKQPLLEWRKVTSEYQRGDSLMLEYPQNKTNTTFIWLSSHPFKNVGERSTAKNYCPVLSLKQKLNNIN